MGQDAGDDRGAPLRSQRSRIVLGLATVAAVYVAGVAVTDADEVLAAFRDARWGVLAVALLLEILKAASLAQVHRSSAAAVRGRLGQRQALNISMSAFTVSQTVPGGGAVAGALVVRRLQRFGLGGAQATASLVLTGSLVALTIALIAAGGLVPTVVHAELPGLALGGVVVLVVVLVGVVVGAMAVLRSPEVARALLRRLGRVHRRIERRVSGWQESLGVVHDQPPTLRSLARIVAWATLNWSADIAALGLVFVAVDGAVPLTALLVGFGVSQVGAAIPITPGGAGFVESGMIGVFVALGVPASVATTVVLLYRILATWLPAGAGAYMLLRPPGAADSQGP